MAARLHALTILASDPDRLALFWSKKLPGDRPTAGTMSLAAGLRECGPAARKALNQMHFHLTSYTASQETNVARALELGATHLDVGQLPDEDHVVLADPEGNEFCVIEETNNWLAGTGFLGELAADGTREVGVFWAAVPPRLASGARRGRRDRDRAAGRWVQDRLGRAAAQRRSPHATGCTSCSAASDVVGPRSSGWCRSGLSVVERRTRRDRDGGPGRQRVRPAVSGTP